MRPRRIARNLVLLAMSVLLVVGGLVLPQSAVASESAATAVAYSPDGLTMSVGIETGEILMYEVATGGLLRSAFGHGGDVTAVAYSPDGRLLASSARDSTVRIWDAATGKEVRVLHGHEQAATSLAFSADGTQIVSGGEDTRILTWDVEAGTLLSVLGGNTDFISAVAVNPDGKTFATATRDARIRLWDGATRRELAVLRGHAGEVTSLAFSPDGRSLASGSTDSTVKVWDVAARREARALRGHAAAVTSVAFSGDGNTIASGSADKTVRLWNARTGAARRTLTGAAEAVLEVVFTPDGSRIAAAAGRSGVREWSPGNGRALRSIAVRAQQALDVAGIGIAMPAAMTSAQLGTGSGGPVLLVTAAADPYSAYYAEILRAEGLTEFASADVATLSAATLAPYEVVLLGARTLTAAQVTTLTSWVTAGGNLVAMRPDSKLAGLLGLTSAGGTLSEGYLLVDTSTQAGNGIVDETMQFHGTADRYTLNGAARVATLYSDATTATGNPAVTLRDVGTSGGQAAAFTYDLARSIVGTRQGNLAWNGQERDGFSPVRSDDLFFGNAAGDPQKDWIDLSKVAIPQADEQQRLLVNLITHMNADRTPLPRFWYLPSGHKAAVVMTGDDHGNNGTAPRFQEFLAASPSGCSVEDWECIRGTSYIYTSTPITNAQADVYESQGFEIGLHVSSSCGNYTAASLRQNYSSQLAAFAAKYPSLDAPRTNRTHCIAWSDWATQATVELENSIRLDTNYYYWPAGWVQDRPGFFTGSGIPMRFTDTTGAMIDVFQAASQMTDESGQGYPYTIDTLLDRAVGAEGYYGVFTVNAHTDVATIPESTTVVNAAKARGVPVVTAEQMLDWLDGRTTSAFQNLSWSGGALSFGVAPGTGARNLTMMVPATTASGALQAVTRNGVPVAHTNQVIKGVPYAFVPATAGSYVATYGTDTAAPTVTSTSPAAGANGVAVSDTVAATFSEAMDASTVSTSTVELRTSGGTLVPASVSYDATTRSARLTPTATLATSTQYTATVKGGSTGPVVRDLAGNPLATSSSWSFTTATGPSCPCSIWPSSATPANPVDNDPNAVELGVRFRSDVDGFVTGVRFWKGSQNSGTHTGNLWSTSGQRLATAVFSNETSSGWQTVTFSSPVAVTANTTYVASYHTTSGYYAGDNSTFASAGVDNGPLHALRDGADGANGLYRYGSTSSFPTSSWRSSNYWVDVVFTTSTGGGGDATPPTLTATTPGDGATGVATGTTVTGTFSEPMDPSTVTTSTVELRGPGATLVPASVTYDATARRATLTPSSALAASTQYTATVKGGSTGPVVRDVAGNALATSRTWTFTTAATPPPSGCPCSIWSASASPGNPVEDDPSAVELGVRFRSDVAGYVTGVRFWKGSQNSGTHTGNLWSTSGQRLATAVFSNETSSGWQTVTFSSPVAVAANTTYIASYHTTSGYYASDADFFASAGVDNAPLHALRNGQDGSNGVYAYGSTSRFPSSTWRSANYWVDVVFTTAG